MKAILLASAVALGLSTGAALSASPPNGSSRDRCQAGDRWADRATAQQHGRSPAACPLHWHSEPVPLEPNRTGAVWSAWRDFAVCTDG